MKGHLEIELGKAKIVNKQNRRGETRVINGHNGEAHSRKDQDENYGAPSSRQCKCSRN